MPTPLLLRGVRLVDVTSPPPTGEDPVDVLVGPSRDGEATVLDVAAHLTAPAEARVVAADGRWLAPGLWDAHVHLEQWAAMSTRLDLSGARDAADACARVRAALASSPASEILVGFGHRTAAWPDQPTVAGLDAVSSGHPVVLVSGDAHHGWLNSAALDLLGLAPRSGVIEGAEWFELWPRLADHPAVAGDTEAAVRRALREAAARGVVGLVDLEFGGAWRAWSRRAARADARTPPMRVRAATYPDTLDQVIARGLRTGDALVEGAEAAQTVTMGPLKMITDGSLHTRTAWCCAPYADSRTLPHPHGVANHTPEELLRLTRRATLAGLRVALHAIGDAAVAAALDAVATARARGSIEHAQLLADADIARMAALSLVASVQPAHLLDDRDVAGLCWPDAEDRCYRFADLDAAGVELAFGSDAPVSPLDPGLAMAAAVHRSGDDRAPWHADQALSARRALAASVDGQPTVGIGSRADLVLLEDNPFRRTGPHAPSDTAALAARLRALPVALTVTGGRISADPQGL